MAHLKIATPESAETPGKTDIFMPGYMAAVWLDGENISRYLTKASVTVDANGIITATLELVLGGLNVDLAGVVTEVIEKETKRAERVV